MNLKTILVGLVVLLLTVGFTLGGNVVNLYNQEITLRNQILAKQQENQTDFDNMWKKIKQVSNVSDKYKEGFAEILTAYTSGRKSDSKNMMMQWGNEAVPNFDNSMLKELNNVIVSSRDDFTVSQKQLIDLNRTHDNLLDTFPNNIIFRMLGVKKIDIKVVTSTRTGNSFKTGKDDDVSL